MINSSFKFLGGLKLIVCKGLSLNDNTSIWCKYVVKGRLVRFRFDKFSFLTRVSKENSVVIVSSSSFSFGDNVKILRACSSWDKEAIGFSWASNLARSSVLAPSHKRLSFEAVTLPSKWSICFLNCSYSSIEIILHKLKQAVNLNFAYGRKPWLELLLDTKKLWVKQRLPHLLRGKLIKHKTLLVFALLEV